jgi:prolyl oligopeptidase
MLFTGSRARLALGILALAMTPDYGARAASDVKLAYPPARRSDHVDIYHGLKVADPYRWMEDIDSPETRSWVEAQGRLSRAFLDATPGRAEMTARLKDIWNFERWSPPVRHGEYWFYSHNDGLQNQAVVFVTRDTGVPGRILIDPNALAADGTVSLRETAVSDDGRLFAYATSDAGSDWQIWHVRDVVTGQDLPDELRWSKFGSASWRKDSSGFYYTRYDPPQEGQALKSANEYQKLYFHKLGTPQSEDRLVYTRRDDPNWFISAAVSEDGHYLVLEVNHGTDVRNAVLVQDLSVPEAPIVPVIAEPTALYNVIDNIGATLLVRTDDGAPRYRIVAIDLGNPEPAHWRTIIPEGPDTLDAATTVGGQLIVARLKDAHSAVARYAPDGRELGPIDLPGLGTAAGFAGRADDRVTYYGYSGFATPPSVFRVELATGAVSLWKSPTLKGFVPDDYQTQQVFFTSKDGTKVPLFIAARRGTPLNGNNPTILYGYGGFNISLTPAFSPAVAAWLQIGGVYAVANIRGGGEYGRAWHEAGMKTRKQTVFDDFAAAARHLVATHWTNPTRLALRGGSNGGLLVGAVEEQNPALAAVVVAQVGVMDMLRFRDFTVGKAWESDYGSVDNAGEFRAMYAYSPYHNVRAGVKYPATLIMTGDHDDRVYPAHSFKFAAAMQHANPHGEPALLYVESRAGHGQGKPTAKMIEEVVDMYAFILHVFGMAH